LSVAETDHAAGRAIQDEIKGQIPEGHGNDRVDCIRIAAADNITEALIDNVDGPALIIGRRYLLKLP